MTSISVLHAATVSSAVALVAYWSKVNAIYYAEVKIY
jgi:hypothetical protein